MKSIATFFATTPEPRALQAPLQVEVPNAEYRALANKLGVLVRTPRSEILEATLHELGIGTYNPKAVHRYLVKHRPFGQVYCWKPLREFDVNFLSQTGTLRLGGQRKDARLRSSEAVYDGDIISFVRYKHAVPYPVLQTVEQIAARATRSIFLVSDYAVPNPDPFLAVFESGVESGGVLYIIERWDEPSFRG